MDHTAHHGSLTSGSLHLYDLSYESYFQNQFHVYVLTSSCDRFTLDALHLQPGAATTADSPTQDNLFREKYAQALDSCAAGSKAKCLILEDDIVFLHDPERTREVLVENTLPLFNDGEIDAFDCTKRGFGWLPSMHTGMGSQCRVYSKHSAPCMSECLRGPSGLIGQLDSGLANGQVVCELRQKRFLLVVHGGLGSTMGRPG
ncbi:hypothetical protein BDW62DRAFT_218537 [Aspergillus aurantiobrunneus]